MLIVYLNENSDKTHEKYDKENVLEANNEFVTF